MGREGGRKRRVCEAELDPIPADRLVSLRPAKLLEAVSPQDPITLSRIVRFAELLRSEARDKLRECSHPCSYCTDDDEMWECDYWSSDEDEDKADTAKSAKVQAPIAGSCPCGIYHACEECVNGRKGLCSEITSCTSCDQFLCGTCDELELCQGCDAHTCRGCARGEGVAECASCGSLFRRPKPNEADNSAG